jgi:hypothetical protein
MLQERLAYEQKLVQLVDRIHAAKGIDNIFIELQGEILELLDADRMTIYAVDTVKKELYSKFLALDDVKEIRLPVSEKSIAGYVAASARIVNIADAYDKAELADFPHPDLRRILGQEDRLPDPADPGHADPARWQADRGHPAPEQEARRPVHQG